MAELGSETKSEAPALELGYICLLRASCLTGVPCQEPPGLCIPPSHFLDPGLVMSLGSGTKWVLGSTVKPEEPLKGCTQTLSESPFLAYEGASFCGLFNNGSSDHTRSLTSKAPGAKLIMHFIPLSTLAYSQQTPHQGHGSGLSCGALPSLNSVGPGAFRTHGDGKSKCAQGQLKKVCLQVS